MFYVCGIHKVVTEPDMQMSVIQGINCCADILIDIINSKYRASWNHSIIVKSVHEFMQKGHIDKGSSLTTTSNMI